MFRIPRPVSDDPEAPDEFRTVLATRDRWWRVGNEFHQTLGSALHVEFVTPVERLLYWPYVTLADRFGRYDLLYVPHGTRTWERWSRHFTRQGAERYMYRVGRMFGNTEFKIVERTT